MKEWGLSFEFQDKEGKNCLFYAIENKRFTQEMVEQILQMNPALKENSIDKKGETLLHKVIQNRKYELASKLAKDY